MGTHFDCLFACHIYFHRDPLQYYRKGTNRRHDYDCERVSQRQRSVNSSGGRCCKQAEFLSVEVLQLMSLNPPRENIIQWICLDDPKNCVLKPPQSVNDVMRMRPALLNLVSFLYAVLCCAVRFVFFVI
jgi:hypothetical protein